jgi:hypothetical protein
MEKNHSSRLYQVVIWAGRISSIALTGLFLSFLRGGEPLPRLTEEPFSVQLIFLGWTITFLGYLTGWRYHILGGLMVFGAIAFMYVSEFATNARLLGPAFLLWLIPGGIYLLAGGIRSPEQS